MTLSLNIGNFFNDSSSHALVDELRKKLLKRKYWNLKKNLTQKRKNLHVYICRFLKNRSISRALASKWLVTMINNKESEINNLKIS